MRLSGSSLPVINHFQFANMLMTCFQDSMNTEIRHPGFCSHGAQRPLLAMCKSFSAPLSSHHQKCAVKIRCRISNSIITSSISLLHATTTRSQLLQREGLSCLLFHTYGILSIIYMHQWIPITFIKGISVSD